MTTPAPQSPSKDFASPFAMVRRLFEELSNLTAPVLPRVDVTKRPDDILVEVDLPGMTAKDVDVTLDGDTLTIDGERKAEVRDRVIAERGYGRFHRTIQLPEHVDPSSVSAHFDNGVLEIELRRASGSQGSRTIDVESR